jgi:phosphoglycerate kinase
MSFAGARMILISHFGEKGDSLQIIARELTKRLSFVHFSPSTDLSDIQTTLQTIPYGEALLLENIRCWQGETENLPSFARTLADLGDIYINDAFSVSHRDHASVTGIPRYILSYLGPTCERELVHLSKALTPPLPTLLIIGGAKISTKLPLINRYLDQGVHVFVGGAMVHAILKARGIHIGNSLYDKDVAIPEDIIYHPNIITPVDVVLDTGETVPVNEVPDGRTIVDCLA